VAQALHHCALRAAFGRKLVDQPLMANVLADLALEQEASLALAMRLARALDRRADAHEDLVVRLLVPVGKYWVCKRTPALTYEAMECIGGSGVMEDGPLPRLFRESPVNAIWEGSGNIQCLDVLRAMQRTPAVAEALFAELDAAKGANAALDRAAAALREELSDAAELEHRARALVDRIALAFQASLLVRHAPAFVADAYCASRLAGGADRNFGTLPRGLDCAAIVGRATPRLDAAPGAP
jgi:putative acyl-CoA dehydrogenase